MKPVLSILIYETLGIYISSTHRLASPKCCAHVGINQSTQRTLHTGKKQRSISNWSINSANLLLRSVAPQGPVAVQTCLPGHWPRAAEV